MDCIANRKSKGSGCCPEVTNTKERNEAEW